MSHGTLIGGTGYGIAGGTSRVGGTAYSIGKGKTLRDGTGYDIPFGGMKVTFIMMEDIPTETVYGQEARCSVKINGTALSAGTTVLDAEKGEQIIVGAAVSVGGVPASWVEPSIKSNTSSSTMTEYNSVAENFTITVAKSLTVTITWEGRYGVSPTFTLTDS